MSQAPIVQFFDGLFQQQSVGSYGVFDRGRKRIVDLLGAIGLVLPPLLRIRTQLIPIVSGCIVLLMVCASIFHMLRGEASVIGVNIVFALLAVFVAWGRSTKAPIADK